MTETLNMSFKIKDCTLISRMAGVREALNLRELEERLYEVPDECLFHHFCERVIRPTFDDPEYTNDFAFWVSEELGDKVLAERLAVLNPYKIASFKDLRMQVLDIIQERLSEIDYITWARKGSGFQFIQAVTVVFETPATLETVDDFYKVLPQISLGSIYYHFVEARRRTESGLDDFSVWISEHGDEFQPLIKALGEIDFYYLSLTELRQALLDTVTKFMKDHQYAS